MSKPASINLLEAIQKIIEEKGDEESVSFFKKGINHIRKVKSGNVDPGVHMAQVALNHILSRGEVELPTGNVFDNPKQGSATPAPELDLPKARATTKGEEPIPEPPKSVPKSPFAILVPTNRDIIPSVMTSIFGNWKASLPPNLRPFLAPFHLEQETVIYQARNVLAQRFLAGGNDWSIWFDSDVLAPIGNGAWFKRRTYGGADGWKGDLNHSALERLTSHEGKTLVGSVYKQRSDNGSYLFNAGSETERVLKILAHPEKGPVNEVLAVNWVPFGCVAVHRKVFLDIMEQRTELKPADEKEPFPFFSPFQGGPIHEDATFCHHAKLAGHQPWLDLMIRPAHIGRKAFL